VLFRSDKSRKERKDDDKNNNNERVRISKRSFVLSIVFISVIAISLITIGPISNSFISSSNAAGPQSPSSPPSNAAGPQSPSSPPSNAAGPQSPSSPPSKSPSSTTSSSSPTTSSNSPSSQSSAPSTTAAGGAAIKPTPQSAGPPSKAVISRAVAITTKALHEVNEFIDSNIVFAKALLACGDAIKQLHEGGSVGGPAEDECARAVAEYFEEHPEIIDAINQGICKSLPFHQLCGKQCVDTSKNPNCGACNNDCSDATQHPSGQVCSLVSGSSIGYACTCPDGQKSCGTGVCMDLQTSSTNCNACGYDCSINYGSGSICQSGTCACPSDKELFNGACVPKCTSDQERINGICEPKQCPYSGQENINGKCVCPAGTEFIFNACIPCGPGSTSQQNGVCVTCPPDKPNTCNNECINLNSPESCGTESCNDLKSCGAPTGGTATCNNGQCKQECPAGEVVQNGACAPCPAGEVVQNGACAPCPAGEVPNAAGDACQSCPSGQTACDGQCVDLSSPQSCGTSTAPGQCTIQQCQNPSGGTAACTNGQCSTTTCTIPGAPGTPSAPGIVCNGACVNPGFDANCGKCDRQCDRPIMKCGTDHSDPTGFACIPLQPPCPLGQGLCPTGATNPDGSPMLTCHILPCPGVLSP